MPGTMPSRRSGRRRSCGSDSGKGRPESAEFGFRSGRCRVRSAVTGSPTSQMALGRQDSPQFLTNPRASPRPGFFATSTALKAGLSEGAGMAGGSLHAPETVPLRGPVPVPCGALFCREACGIVRPSELRASGFATGPPTSAGRGRTLPYFGPNFSPPRPAGGTSPARPSRHFVPSRQKQRERK